LHDACTHILVTRTSPYPYTTLFRSGAFAVEIPLHHKSTAHGEIAALKQQLAIRVVAHAAHAVGMEGQDLERMKENVGSGIEAQGVSVQHRSALCCPHVIEQSRYAIDVHRFRIMAGQAQNDGGGRAKAAARGA